MTVNRSASIRVCVDVVVVSFFELSQRCFKELGRAVEACVQEAIPIGLGEVFFSLDLLERFLAPPAAAQGGAGKPSVSNLSHEFEECFISIGPGLIGFPSFGAAKRFPKGCGVSIILLQDHRGHRIGKLRDAAGRVESLHRNSVWMIEVGR